MKRNISIIKNFNGEKIVLIKELIFKGRRNIDWTGVENYLKQYVGEIIEIIETKDKIYIDTNFIDEYAGSQYTAKLKGTIAKAKANAAQGIPELIEIAVNKRFKENLADKHKKNAKNGWYRYNSKFALPVFNEQENIVRYNIFNSELIIRYAANNKLYLYDIININKETSTPLEQ